MYLKHEFKQTIDAWEAQFDKLKDLKDLEGQELIDGLNAVMKPANVGMVPCEDNIFLGITHEIAVHVRKKWKKLRHAIKKIEKGEDAHDMIKEVHDTRKEAFDEARDNIDEHFTDYSKMVKEASDESSNWRGKWKEHVKKNKTKVGNEYFIKGKKVNVS